MPNCSLKVIDDAELVVLLGDKTDEVRVAAGFTTGRTMFTKRFLIPRRKRECVF